jgi:hypothetical protein
MEGTMSNLQDAFKIVHFKNSHERLFGGSLVNAVDLYDTLEMLDGNTPTFSPEKELYILTLEELVVFDIESGGGGNAKKFLSEIEAYSRETQVKDQFVLIEYLILKSMYLLSTGDSEGAMSAIRSYNSLAASPGVEDIDSTYAASFARNMDNLSELIPVFKARMKNMLDSHFDWILDAISKR